MTAPPVSPSPAKKPRLRRALGWVGGVSLCLLLAAVVTRAVLIRQMRWPRMTIAQPGNVMSVAVTPDGQTIFTGDDPTQDALHTLGNKPADVFVWDAASGRLIRRLPAFYWRSSGTFASPDGGRVLACGYTRRNISVADASPSQMAVWDWRTGQKVWSVPGDLPLTFSPDGRFVGCENGVYDAASGRLICRASKRIAEDGQTAFTPDGKWYGTVGDINLDPKTHKERQTPDFESDVQFTYSTTRLHFWRTDTGKEAKDFPFTRVRAFDIARSGQWLVMASDTGMMNGEDGAVVRRVDIQTGELVWTWERHMNGPNPDPDSTLNSIAISPNGKYVVLGSMNSHLIVLDAQTGRELFRPFIPPGTTIPSWAIPGGLAFSADGKTLVSRCGRRVLVWDASSLQ